MTARPSAARRGYGGRGSQRWRTIRDRVIADAIARELPCGWPGCRDPRSLEETPDAELAVDHWIPLQDDPGRRLDPGNLSVMHADCHRRKTGAERRERARGYSNASAADGRPLDPRHPFNQRPEGTS